jgi:glycosyltransferase involved in cell wall biosynthesis
MIRLFINGLAASAGGGLTYLRNVIPQLACRSEVETTVLLGAALRREFSELPPIRLVESQGSPGALRRFIREQTELPKLIRKNGSQVLVSAGNFALWNSPVPQILLSRNALYTSAEFRRDVRQRGDYGIWADTAVKGWLARQSIARAEVNLAPTHAFADALTDWSGRKVFCLHHGFDPDFFRADSTPLPAETRAHLEDASDALRLLFVSHYNYYRNFETLFRSLPILSERLQGRKVKLFLTCRLGAGGSPGPYRSAAASSLVQSLRSRDSIVELGAIPYGSLHHLYGACHLYVSPAYAESFAHPLVEAMSSGLPVVASDIPVHREICRDAAFYFPTFSPDGLAQAIARICQSPTMAAEIAGNGMRRAQDFRWDQHVDRLLDYAKELVVC